LKKKILTCTKKKKKNKQLLTENLDGEHNMSNKEAYMKLIERHREWVFGLPDSEFLMPLLELRFTSEEAEFLSNLPFMPHTAEKLSESLNIDIDVVSEKLDDFAKRGLVMRVEGRRRIQYALTDAIFNFYRMPGWKGGVDEWNRKIVPYINQYYIDAMANEFLNHPTQGLRAIPINETIKDPRKIMPYEDILKVIDSAKYFAVSTCACRHRHNLDPEFEECKHETMNCLHFDTLGKYTVQNGLGKEITKEETLEILAKAADAGLVHGVSNTKNGVDTICNCCPCCCLYLESIVKMPAPVPRGHQPSNYVREIDEEKCIGCGLCARRCPMKAIDHIKEEKRVIFNPDQCIGCGVCVHKCPKEAIYLVHSEGEIDVPSNMMELGLRLLNERGRNLDTVRRKNTL